jgi:hypothetical protein
MRAMRLRTTGFQQTCISDTSLHKDANMHTNKSHIYKNQVVVFIYAGAPLRHPPHLATSEGTRGKARLHHSVCLSGHFCSRTSLYLSSPHPRLRLRSYPEPPQVPVPRLLKIGDDFITKRLQKRAPPPRGGACPAAEATYYQKRIVKSLNVDCQHFGQASQHPKSSETHYKINECWLVYKCAKRVNIDIIRNAL